MTAPAIIETARRVLSAAPWSEADLHPESADGVMRDAASALARAVLAVEALADQLDSAAAGSRADPSAGTWTLDRAELERETAQRIRAALNGDDQ